MLLASILQKDVEKKQGFIIVIIVLVFAIFRVYSKLEVEVKLNSEYEEKIEEKKESYSVINNNKIELEEKFNNLENIDSMTDSVKDEVLNLLWN